MEFDICCIILEEIITSLVKKATWTLSEIRVSEKIIWEFLGEESTLHYVILLKSKICDCWQLKNCYELTLNQICHLKTVFLWKISGIKSFFNPGDSNFFTRFFQGLRFLTREDFMTEIMNCLDLGVLIRRFMRPYQIGKFYSAGNFHFFF